MTDPSHPPRLRPPLHYVCFQCDRAKLVGRDPAQVFELVMATNVEAVIEAMPYYRTDSGTFVDIGEGEDEISLLEKIFVTNQNEVRPDPTRWPSMAMGDVVCLGERFWLCAMTDWVALPGVPHHLDMKGPS